MKVFWRVMGVLAAIAALAFVVITYGDRIAAWGRKLLSTICWEDCCDEDFCDDDECCDEADFVGE